MRGDGSYLDLSTEQIRFRLRKISNPNPPVNFHPRNLYITLIHYKSISRVPSVANFRFEIYRGKLGCYVIEAKKTSPSRRADRSRIASTNLIEIRVNLVPSKNGRPFYACEQITTDDTRADDTSNTMDNLEIRAKSSQRFHAKEIYSRAIRGKYP